MGELSLLEKFRAEAPTHPWISVGPGSDCAVLNWPAETDQLFKIDQVVEGTHFVLSGPEAATPEQVGWKAMAKTCSDIAAAGGWPVAAMVSMNLKKGTPEAVAQGVYEGLTACCRKFEFGLAGGDFATSENGLSIAVSLLGKTPKNGAWTRGGAKPGDVLFVTGLLGGSRQGKHLKFRPRLEEARAIRELVPEGVHACIDITDGLSRDLRHLCNESHCGAIIYSEVIPVASCADPENPLRSALSDGEDFELLLAVSPDDVGILTDTWNYVTPLTQIGIVVGATRGISLVGRNGQAQDLADTGYEHTL